MLPNNASIDQLKRYVEDMDNELAHVEYDKLVYNRLYQLDPDFLRELDGIKGKLTFYHN